MKYKNTHERKMKILILIDVGINKNAEIEFITGMNTKTIVADKETLLFDGILDSTGECGGYFLTDLGDDILKNGFEKVYSVPTEEVKLKVLEKIHNYRWLTLNEIAVELGYQKGAISYHKKWLLENGFLYNKILTDRGLKALNDKSISKYMEV